MSHNGIWGGDLEINAISQYYKCNVIVYQDSRPNLELQGFPRENRVLQLAYFGSCHYNSVRGKGKAVLSSHSTGGNIVLQKDDVRSQDSVDKKTKEGKEKAEKVKSVKEEKELEKSPKSEETREKEKTAATQQTAKKEKKSKDISTSHLVRKFLKVTTLLEQRIRSSKMDDSLRQTVRKRINEMRNSVEMAGKEKPNPKTIAKRNIRIFEEFESLVTRSNRHHTQRPGEWCGDLSFDELVSFKTRLKLLFVERESQVRNCLSLLTRKCPCHSGSYFKFCCYPKMKAW